MPERETIERAREDAREGKSPALKRVNSYVRRCITSAKANMAQPLRNRQSQSDSRRRAAQASSCPRHPEVKRPLKPARRPRAITAKGKATPG